MSTTPQKQSANLHRRTKADLIAQLERSLHTVELLENHLLMLSNEAGELTYPPINDPEALANMYAGDERLEMSKEQLLAQWDWSHAVILNAEDRRVFSLEKSSRRIEQLEEFASYVKEQGNPLISVLAEGVLNDYKYGYARVSTAAQDLETQIDALKAQGCEHIFSEKVSGAKTERHELAHALRELQSGDELHVTKLDRLGRNMRELHKIAEQLEDRNVSLVINGQKHDPTTPTGRLLFNVLAMVAEFERDMIAERTAEKLAHIKQAGGRIGRRRVTTKKQDALIKTMLSRDFSYADIADAVSISKSTVSRISRAATDELAVSEDPTLARRARVMAIDREKELQRFQKQFAQAGKASSSQEVAA